MSLVSNLSEDGGRELLTCCGYSVSWKGKKERKRQAAEERGTYTLLLCSQINHESLDQPQILRSTTNPQSLWEFGNSMLALLDRAHYAPIMM